MPDEDPRLSDEATGLPPLEELGTDEVMLVLAWAGGEGVASSPISGKAEACRYLHLRGLAAAQPRECTNCVHGEDPKTRSTCNVCGGTGRMPLEYGAEWVQLHLAVPVEHAVDVAATLAMGATP